ncbi:DNA-binding SARP family transcriptional activator [Kibdelosporangium banguiense]|uniref:DNA-binding SARP family transcriptional activator n=1 Tax=Kibdelosporangium banguiense TaxID=1365924 RepID=A0ABS4T6F2_9PSEU|nr:BTAD domain-containing putative transcriptional regulator [Kibdelosporangium banguiense]MBP2320002.1 DNA-binding SARP family transcriptional activator [Kibdelosporangium banguiense]
MRAEVQLLGPVRILRDGREQAVGSARQRAVLAVLAINAGRVVGKDELLWAVWGQPRPASAMSNLYSYIAGLRRVLDVETAPAGYVLGIERAQVDARRFEQLYWRGQVAKDDRQAEETLVRALELWRGDALSKVPGPFAEGERPRLAERRLKTMEELSRVRLRRGAAPVAELEHMVTCHPQRPVFRELLMKALALSGRRAEALRLFRDTMHPGPALRRIQAQVLAGEDVYDESA